MITSTLAFGFSVRVGTTLSPFLTMRLMITRERLGIGLVVITEHRCLHNVGKHVLSDFLLW
jgi:hypothetical protein